MKATLTRARISYKKMRPIAALVKGKKVSTASAHLRLMPKKNAQILNQVILSAAANAENNDKQNREELIIDSIIINKGPVLRRWRPISRGRAHPYRKQTAHIQVNLSLAPTETEKTTTKKTTPKAEKTTTKKPTPTKKTTTTSNTSKSK